jgi:hypothetical protein
VPGIAQRCLAFDVTRPAEDRLPLVWDRVAWPLPGTEISGLLRAIS